MLILLTVWHTFHIFCLSLTDSQNFPGPLALFQDFPGFPGPVQTLLFSYSRYQYLLNLQYLHVKAKDSKTIQFLKRVATSSLLKINYVALSHPKGSLRKFHPVVGPRISSTR